MQMSRARTRTGNADMQSAAFQTDGEITRNNANQNFNQRDRNSRSDRDQTADERQAHPDRGDKPNVLEHEKLLPLGRSHQLTRFSRRSAGMANSIALDRALRHPFLLGNQNLVDSF